MDDDNAGLRIGRGYPLGQLAKAFVTAVSHEDAETRRHAEERLRRWEQVLAGMANGTLAIGSRTPVTGLPAWVTPQVVRGGFATGAVAAGGTLLAHETQAAHRAGVAPDRRALFAYCLTEPGLAALNEFLDTGQYRVDVPEEAALLTVAWLLRAGDRLAALRLLDTLEPFADQLRFAPRPADVPIPDPEIVWRETAGDARDAAARRRPNARVEAMREALTVWNPYADALLALWLETVVDGRVGRRFPSDWTSRAAGLLDEYQSLAATHTRCSKHRKPKENIFILRVALEAVVLGRSLEPRQLGMLQNVFDSMLARRGRPGSERHMALRDRQAADAAQPTHHAIAQVVAARLASLPQEAGVGSTAPLLGPVTAQEERQSGVPAGNAVPRSIRLVVERALAGPIEELIDRGVLPSSEVLARLVPQIAAATTAVVYPDKALRSLMAANYRAFRNRRSLLLLNLEHQVQVEELPWVQAVSPQRRAGDRTQQHSRAALVRLGELAIAAFPATILPNPLVRELDALAREAGLDLPFVEELAADIFMGTFSAKFLQAAKLAADLLEETLYARYYGIDYGAARQVNDVAQQRRFFARTSNAFASLCVARAGGPADRWSVPANGTVIEQAQILTTHNLATLVQPVGVAPTPGWPELARRSFRAVWQLVSRVHNNPRPLGTIKDAAYAWRQTLLYLALTSHEDQAAFVAWAREQVRAQPAHTTERLDPVVAGLAHVLAGGMFDADGVAGEARRFLGWAVGGHWMQPRRPEARR
jgi:hypothetical protein